MARFTIEHLTHKRLLAAWPIIRASGAEPCAEWWLNDAMRLIDDGGGVLAARAPDGIVHGVAIYRIARDQRFGRILSVASIVTFELRRRAPVRQALCDALDELSLTLECKGIGMADCPLVRQQLSKPFFPAATNA
jgi:hypothetical protein